MMKSLTKVQVTAAVLLLAIPLVSSQVSISCDEETCHPPVYGSTTTTTTGVTNPTTYEPGGGGGGIPTTALTGASVSGCGVVYKTTDVCSTCVRPQCELQATVTVTCGCRDPVATIYQSHPCSMGCAGLGCYTDTTVVSVCSTTGSGGGGGGAGTSTTGGSGTGPTATATGTATGTGTAAGGGGGVTAGTTGAGGSGVVSSSSTGPVSANAGGRLVPFRLW
ncbi:hypothetical protein QBC46DRAFT_355364 [Diplogelasinospora grovesii]|uniref:Uncharacterized protein n=1 Tax=Diplogelasinospora grovesii TaxID=303347 RepID=A0AAN6N7X7_9PEZI|nr:hypothetical protein QBC46DRAFT_355364 [Diplogelasinospora grovesii]